MRADAPTAFSRWTLSKAAWFSWYEKYSCNNPLVTSAPLTRMMNTATYLRNSVRWITTSSLQKGVR